jgi:hypothetical protein
LDKKCYITMHPFWECEFEGGNEAEDEAEDDDAAAA